MPRRVPRRVIALVAAIVVGVLAIVVAYVVVPRPATATPCGPMCLRLTVAVTIDKGGRLHAMADDFNAGNATYHGRRIQVDVHAEASGETEQGLVGDNDTPGNWDVTRHGYARPHVWIPAATEWVRLLSFSGSPIQPLAGPGNTVSIAQTPLVLAMPKKMAQVLGWPKGQIDWSTIAGLVDGGWARYGQPDWGQFKLGRTNPAVSVSGLLTSIAWYQYKAGRRGPLTMGDVTNDDARVFVHRMEESVVHYGPTSMAFFLRLRAVQDGGGEDEFTYVSAIACEEKSVYDYNTGTTGDTVHSSMGPPDADRQIVALYPSPTPVADSPYVELNTITDPDLKGAADRFRDFLLADAQQARFRQAGLRDAKGNFDPDIVNQKYGMLPSKPEAVPAPEGPVLGKILESWPQLRKPSRVLLLLDASQSMGDRPDAPAGPPVSPDDPNSCTGPTRPTSSPTGRTSRAEGGGTKLDLLKTAATYALGRFGPNDDVGLWTFGGGLGQWGEVVPMSPIARAGTREQLTAAIGNLKPGTDTPLFRAVLAAQAWLAQHSRPDAINAVVVLTDGRNNDQNPGGNRNCANTMSLLKQAAAPVRVFTIGYGHDADVVTLQGIADATQAQYYDATDPYSIDRVLRDVVSNF
jgi:Ca-activated chloride channel family protein